MKRKSVIICIFWGLILIFSGCNRNSQQKYPQPLSDAIQYFYIENRNDEVIKLINTLTDKDISIPEVAQISSIFRAAALCEMAKTAEADSLFRLIKCDNRNPRIVFWYQSIQGLILFRQDSLPKAYEVLSKACTSTFTNQRALGLNKRLLARISFALDDQNKGVEWLLESNEHFKKAHLKKSLGINQKILGRFYMNSNNFKESIACFDSAKSIIKKQNDPAELFYVYINLIDYYLKTNNLDSAKLIAVKCSTECKKASDNSMRSILYNNLGEIDLLQNKFNVAIEHFKATLLLPNNYTDVKMRQINAHTDLAKSYCMLNQPQKALAHAMKAKELFRDNKNYLLSKRVYYELSKTNDALHNYEQAYHYMDTSNAQLDSAYNSIAKTTKAFYEAKADVIEATANTERIKQSEQRRRLVYIFIIFTLFLLFVFSNSYYQLQRSRNKVLKALVKKNLQIIEEERKIYQIALNESAKKGNRKGTTTDKSDMLYTDLLQWLEIDKRFSRNDLSLELISKELNTNREYLSQALSNHNVRFNDLLNKRRVEEAIQILSDPTNKRSRYSLLVIANEVGFNSNSVFIDAFRKQTGMNPSQFRQNLTLQKNG
jgi:AraC-like DNA-binding protein